MLAEIILKKLKVKNATTDKMDSKDYFSTQRQCYLESVSTSEKRLILRAEEMWGRYCFTPLAIPCIADPIIQEWFLNYKKPITKIKPDIAGNTYGESNFESIDIFDNESPNDVWSSNQYKNFKTDFKDFYNQLMDLLPFKRLESFSFWSSTRLISPHRDQTVFVDLPLSFRVMLYDSNPEQTLWVKECPPGKFSFDQPADKFFIPRLDSTNSFAWNNLRVIHGSDCVPEYYKILLIINFAEIDWFKYYKLIEQSVDRYEKNLLVSNSVLGDYVNCTQDRIK